MSLDALMRGALDLQREGELGRAAALYEQALALSPELPDALHMLGVVHLQQGRSRAALPLLHRAARAFGWQLPAVRHNVGLAVAALVAHRPPAGIEALHARLAALCDAREAAAGPYHGRVSVVVPSYNHAAYVASAIASLRAQTRPPDEIVVVDDGSTDSSVARIHEALRGWPGAIVHARGNRGAAATINEGIAMTSGDYVNVLNSDDRFAPDRLATLCTRVAAPGADIGFMRTACIDGDGRPSADPRAGEFALMIDDVAARDSVGMALIAGNATVSSGNLFFSRRLFDALGGFADFRYNHDWDFVLRASLLTEPVFVPATGYEYRFHGSNTISESAAAATREMIGVFTRFYRTALAVSDPLQPFAPVPAVWGLRFFECVLAAGHAAMLPVEVLDGCVLHVREAVA